MNTIGYFEIHSTNPEREIKFYQSVFGWRFVREKSFPIEYYRIEINGIHGGLLKCPPKEPTMQGGINAFVCSVQVENFDKTSEQILTSGGQIAKPKFAIPTLCWQGYFIDGDNNTFGVFEVDEHAI